MNILWEYLSFTLLRLQMYMCNNGLYFYFQGMLSCSGYAPPVLKPVSSFHQMTSPTCLTRIRVHQSSRAPASPRQMSQTSSRQPSDFVGWHQAFLRWTGRSSLLTGAETMTLISLALTLRIKTMSATSIWDIAGSSVEPPHLTIRHLT